MDTSNLNHDTTPLAVIGFATRFAQEATSADRFWELLLRRRQAATPFPKERFNSSAFYHPDPEHGGTFYVKGAHFLSEDPLGFDAPFFNVNKTEILSLDPQQRVAMENVYHALENAGIPMEKAVGSKTSVYASGFNRDHMILMDADFETAMKHKPTGGQQSIISNRVSWFYDFSGPSITIDTACSSGIVAVHLAAQSLKSGDAEMAVVTGGSIISHVPDIIAMSHSGFLGPEGKCFSFDHRAEGYGRGEGVGTVVMKTLANALRDGDTIRAVIRATGVNQDGRTPGITLPSSTAQTNLIKEVYRKASLDRNTTMFVEAHGTGTAAGDPIEARGIADGFTSMERESPLYIGALKSNIGHLEGGAGIAGIIKSVMVLESGIIPPNANFEKANPQIPTKEWQIDFPTECIPWPKSGLRRVSVNSFGFGGTNAHCVLDDAYHFLEENGLSGNHNTRQSAPTKQEISELLARLQRLYLDGDVNHSNGTAELTNGEAAKESHEPVESTAPNETNGTTEQANGETAKESREAECSASNGVDLTTDKNVNEPQEVIESAPIQETNGPIEQGNEEITNGSREAAELSPNNNGTNGIAEHPNGETEVESPTPNGINGATTQSEVPRLLILSTADKEGMSRVATSLREYLASKPDLPMYAAESLLDDLAYTLSEKRSRLRWKGYLLANSISALEENLADEKALSKCFNARSSPRLGFVFTGQGAQYHRMGQQLLVYPVFRKSLEEATEYMKALGSSWSLMDEILKDKGDSRISTPSFSHPACASIQVALVELLASWDIIPSRVVGHSSGEIAAAYCAGKLSREAAWKTAYYRGFVSAKQSDPKGAMLAVGLDQEALRPYLEKIHADYDGELIIACYNSPKNNTVAGDETMVDVLKTLLDADGIFARKLNVQNAYHSAHMKAVADEYFELMGTLEPGRSSDLDIQMHSTVTGKMIMDSVLDASYWVDNMVSPVKFTTGLRSMLFQSNDDNSENKAVVDEIIEIGPHGAMQSAVKEIIAASSSDIPVSYSSVLNRNEPTVSTLLNTIGTLACKTFPVNLQEVNQSVHRGEKRPQFLVNLPPYAFNHEEKGYYESRLAKNVRQREFPRHQLLGAPVQDWTRFNRKWRQFFRLSENPWLRDHVVTDNCIFPGAGYLVMALEAVKQTAGEAVEITGIRFKDVSIKAALLIPDTNNGVEVSLSVFPVNESNQWTSTVWKYFQVSSYIPSYNDWVEHCSGYVALEYEASAPDVVGNGREGKAAKQAWDDALDQAAEVCQTPLDAGKVYENLETIGMKYGPLFRNLSNLSVSGKRKGTIFGEMKVPNLGSVMPKGYIHPHVIHPTTLDNTLVAGLVAICDDIGQTVLKHPMVPTFIKEAWISTGISSQEGTKFRCYGEVSTAAYESYDYSSKCWDLEANEPRIMLSGVRMTPLASDNTSESNIQIGYGIDWKPAINVLETKEFLDLDPVMAKTPYEEQLSAAVNLQLGTALMIADGLADLKENPPAKPLEGHMKIYFDWMERVIAELESGTLQHVPLELFKKYSEDKGLKEQLYESLKRDYATDGEILIRSGVQIAPVVREEIDPLYLLFGQDDLLARHYEEVIVLNDGLRTVQNYLSMVSDNFNGLEILEVGSGTGSFTKLMLKSLCPRSEDGQNGHGAGKIANYTFTDISPSFFSKAKERLEPWKDLLTFHKLDIGTDPLAQGFSAAKYDIIVANNVLHATPDLQKTLEHCRLMLKPGGKFLIQEGVRPDIHWVSLVFGQLPGWWLSKEPVRKWCPYITVPEWNSFLQDAGFSGLDIDIPSSHFPELAHVSTMVATAVEDTSKSGVKDKEVVILCHVSENETDLIAELKAEIANDLGATNCLVLQPCDLVEKGMSDAICISLLELQTPVIFDLSEEEFKRVQCFLSSCRKLLWITGDSRVEPAFNMINGMLRTIRWERDAESLDFTTLATADFGSTPNKQLVHAISKVFRFHFVSGQTDHANSEYLMRNKLVYTNRIVDYPTATNFLASQSSTPAPEMTAWKDVGRPVKLQNPAPGLLNKLQWVTDTSLSQSLEENEVEIEIRAVGLNFVDLLTVMGELPWDVVGREAAGVVTKVGSAVHWLQPGDRVVYLVDTPKKGTFQTYSRVDQGVVARIPNDMSFEVAAGLPVIYATVIYGLENVGRLAEGEKVLIHSAAGGVGQAAIQYAQAVGAEIFATVSTVEKKELIMKEYGIAEDHIFSSRDFSFVKGVKRLTGNTGVDVVLNSLSREALRRSWECVAPFGRFIEIGKKDLVAGGKLDMSPFVNNIMFAGVDLLALAEHRPKVVQQVLKRTMQLWTERKITGARPNTALSYAQLEEGLRMLQSGKHTGKIVFAPNAEDVVPVVPEIPPPFEFDPNASYILAGGLGGIGRSLAQWMVTRGAKHLVFLSRSGNITRPVEEMISALEGKGCQVKIFKCDVSDIERMCSVVEECQQTLPPIKGCIQGSMILRDGAFENLSYLDWNTVTKPKVQGSLNLYEALPKDLDFFLMLSSVGGIMGGRSQANYAAGNTYQDALARSLVSKGVRAASLDLGSVLSVGFVAENKDYTRHVSRTIGSMREDEVHSMVEYLIDPRHSLTESTCQVIFGLGTVKSFQDRGVPPPECFNYPAYTILRNTTTSGDQAGGDTQMYHVQALLATAKSRDEAAEVVSNGINRKLSVLLNVAGDQIDSSRSIRDNGVDSLIAMEFRTWLAKELGAELPLIEIMAEGSITDLSKKVAALSKYVQDNFREASKESS
ncbi:iterative type I polyketide synthase [Coccidioides immitis RS]|uniref:Non-reducing polyketide synthase nscA n=1 Tax=Coccidioides immitis (strain RS) TaxID=246410 RepID=J3KAF0_COCIM|nr:iterative type I polyketide synthase [Coccidioides immitis RS]EAS31990.3 iterative type I polyketide synthase [Coccidioides immitis RS]